jgi:hypothetical protein
MSKVGENAIEALAEPLDMLQDYKEMLLQFLRANICKAEELRDMYPAHHDLHHLYCGYLLCLNELDYFIRNEE